MKITELRRRAYQLVNISGRNARRAVVAFISGHSGHASRRDRDDPEPVAYSMADASRRIGVTGHALLTWERLYGFPKPLRSPLGLRRYPAEQVETLRRLLEQATPGLSIGQMILDHVDGAPGEQSGRG